MDALRNRIMVLVAEQLERPMEVTPQRRFVDDLGFDSMKMFTFISILEEELDILIPIQSAYSIKTVDDLCEAVRRLVPADSSMFAPA